MIVLGRPKEYFKRHKIRLSDYVHVPKTFHKHLPWYIRTYLFFVEVLRKRSIFVGIGKPITPIFELQEVVEQAQESLFRSHLAKTKPRYDSGVIELFYRSCGRG